MGVRKVIFALLIAAVATAAFARHRSAPSTPAVEVSGVIKSLTTSQLVLTTKNGDVTITITKDTIFRSGDMAIAPTDLKNGDRVEVKVVRNGNDLDATVVKLEAQEQEKPEFLEISGVIKTASPTEIVVTNARGQDVTVEITKDTVIRKNGQAATAADLAKDQRVEIKAVQSGTTTNAVLVTIEQQEQQKPQFLELNGTIKTPGTTEIVVTNSRQQDTTIGITKDTVIRKNDQPATAADLKTGDRVEVKALVNGTTTTAVFIDDETEAPEQEDAEVSGNVSAVGTNSITVNGTTVNVDANTRIRKDDKTIALGDIKTGDSVKAEGVRVDAHTILARDIEVKSR